MKIKTFFSAAILHTSLLFPQTWTWNVPGSGNWSTPVTNWSPPVTQPGTIPNAVGAIASFGDTLTSAATVTLDITPIIVGTLTFPSATYAFNYTIAATGSNTFNMQGSAGGSAIMVTGGTQTISAPMVLMNPLTVTQNSPMALTLSGVISGASSTSFGGSGTTVLSGVNLYSGGTTVTSGTLDCNTAATLPPAGPLTITGGTVNCNIANALPSTGTVTVSGGTLMLNSNNQATGAIAGTTNIILGSAALTSTTSISTTYSGIISGAGSFTLAGSGGLLNVSGANSYMGTTTVNGSTLQLGANGAVPMGTLAVNSPGVFDLNSLSQTVNVLSGNGSITLGTSPGNGLTVTSNTTNSTFSGVISGGGEVIKQGTATLTLSGNNTFTSALLVDQGTVVLSISSALSTQCPVDLALGTTLDMTGTQQSVQSVNESGAVILTGAQLTVNPIVPSFYGFVPSGTMSGAGGSLIMAGPSTYTLQSQNTFDGGTTVTGGSLILGITNALLPTGNLTVNTPGIFNLAGFSQTVAILSGTGSITLGGGILTVNTPAMAVSNFPGVISQAGSLIVGGTGTLILNGANTYSGGTTVNAGANLQGTTISLQGAIANSGTLIFNQNFSGTFSGPLTGAGSLIITGGGALTLTGTPTEGNTTVSQGELIIASGANLTSSVTIASGASLGGSGTITGNVINHGTFQLGLNTFSIAGNYTQAANSSFNTEITPSSSGLLAVTGSVGITSPAAMVITLDPGAYSASMLYTLITAGSPVTGTFNPPVFTNPFFTGSLIYNNVLPGSVQLLLQIAPFGNVIKGGNAGAIAKCINLNGIPGESDLLPIVQALIFLPLEEVREALDAMQPSQLKALSLAEENNLVTARTTLSQRVDEMSKTNCNQCMSEMYHWNIWSNVNGDIFRQEEQRDNVGFKATTGAAFVGIDRAITNNLFVGLAGGYHHTLLDWEHSRGYGTIQSYDAGSYLSFFNRRIELNLSCLASWNEYHVSRHIVFPTVDRHARSTHHGMGLISHTDFGVMLYPAHNMSFTPFVGADYIHVRENPFHETGAGGLNFRYRSSHSSLWRSELGFKISKCAVFVHTKWTLDLKGSWIHQFLLRGKRINANFEGVDCTFRVKGPVPNPDYLDVAAGLTGFFIEDKLSGSLRYEGKFGDGIRDNTAYADLTYRF